MSESQFEEDGITLEFKVSQELAQKTKRLISISSHPIGQDQFFFLKKVTDETGVATFVINPKLTIGNEQITDKTLSSRHATFQVAQGILTLVDNRSLNGVYVDGRKIPAGETIILMAGDRLLLGGVELEVFTGGTDELERLRKNKEHFEKIKKREKSFFNFFKKKAKPVKPVEPPPLPKEAIVKQEIKKVEPPTLPKAVKQKPKTVVKAPKRTERDPVAGAFSRLFALVGDLALAFSLHSFLMGLKEFNFLAGQLIQQVRMFYLPWIKVAFLKTLEQDVAKSYSYLLVFILLQLISVLLFSVTFSQWVMGLKGSRNFLWSRFGGILRTFLGVITFPFVIFDMPCLFGKRTLK
ncbi:MAG: FHA domain-containing protein, partial [Bacteriovoracaceae bacterium]|nr:FHA domain-containing protein [Bacteriovoracaceae bacterium]